MSTPEPVLRSPPFPARSEVDAAIATTRTVAAAAPFGAEQRVRAETLRAIMIEHRVGGTFWAALVSPALAPRIVLCPQSAAMAQAMLLRSRTADDTELLAIVPAGRSAAATVAWLRQQNVPVIVGEVDPWSLLDGARCLMASGDDERLFLARARGIAVQAFGPGCHATADTADLASEVHTLLVEQATYRDVFSNATSTPEAAMVQLSAWRSLIDANRAVCGAVGMAGWKRRELRSFLWAGQSAPRFFRRSTAALEAAVAQERALAVWPSRVPPRLFAAAETAGVPLLQVEDGFIRSVGLGSALHPPLSIVVDTRGIYYDPNRPSDLETMLEHGAVTPELLARAERLIEIIVARGISKYASGSVPFTDLPSRGRRVLVTGQVEDDRSVRLGGAPVTGNLDLLRRVRAAEPDAYILFKPHPDVEAGHRPGHVANAAALRFADAIVRDATMAALLDAVDAVHVWTSLAGFEALLRGREVIVHGTPFFAGWGLTRDLGPANPRRTRRVSLAQLVAATLILYPRYLDPVTYLPCTPEVLIDRMLRSELPRPTLVRGLRALQGRARRWLIAVCQ